MITLSPHGFLLRFPQLPAVRDHHFTGPKEVQQAENHGSVFHSEGCILTALAAYLGGPVLEIGANLGISTRYIHEGLELHGKGENLVYSVDGNHLWGDDPEWPLRVRIPRWSQDYHPPACRWAFIDGNHSAEGVKVDIEKALEAGCGGMLFHDTEPGAPPFELLGSGTDARAVVLEVLEPNPEWSLYDITTHCGMIWAEARP